MLQGHKNYQKDSSIFSYPWQIQHKNYFLSLSDPYISNVKLESILNFDIVLFFLFRNPNRLLILDCAVQL